MRYEGKIINKKTIENLKILLSKEVQEDYRKAATEEEKEIIQTLEILSYSLIDSEEEEKKAKKDPNYLPKKEKTIGDISFGGTTKEILTNATTLRDIFKYNHLIKNSNELKNKALYKDIDTFEFTLNNGQTLTFKKPIIQEDITDMEIPAMEEYLRDFYEKYNKENLKLYYESYKYKGETPRIKYPHEFLLFEPGKEPRIRYMTESNAYYNKVITLAKEKTKKENNEKQEKVKNIFRKKRKDIIENRKKQTTQTKTTNIIEAAEETTKDRHKVVNKIHASDFFRKTLYKLRAGAGSLTHKETWASLWKTIKPVAIAGVVTSVFAFTPVGKLLTKAILSCAKLVPLAIGNASKLIPYYLGTTTMSSAMVSACILNLASLIAAAGITIWIIALIVKSLRKKGIKVEEKLEKEVEQLEEQMLGNEKSIPSPEKEANNGYFNRIKDLKTQIKELEIMKANLEDPTTKEQNQETYYKILLKKLEEEKKEEQIKILDQARKDGTLISKYNDEIREQINQNIAVLNENIDILVEQYETEHFNGLNDNKGMVLS